MSKLTYRRDIDGLRAIAVGLVVIYHAGFAAVSGGYVGVDVFFVISGFLITGIVAREVRDGTFRYRDFYIRRIKRLLPAFLVVALVTTVAALAILLPDDLTAYTASLVSALFGISNVFFSLLSGGYFAARTEVFPLLHTWSLSVEEQYYLVWPALLALLFKLKAMPRAGTLMIAFVALVALSIRASAHDPNAAYYLIQYRAFELMIGALLAIYWHRVPVLGPRLASALSLGALGGIIAMALTLTRDSVFPGWNALWLCALTALLIATGKSPGALGNRLLTLSPMVGLGVISYSLYLWHWPILAFLRYRQIDLVAPVALLAIALAVVLATATYLLVENPMRRSRKIDFRQAFGGLYAAPVVVCLAFAAAVYFSGGLMLRYDAPLQRLVGSYSVERDLSRRCSIRPDDQPRIDRDRLTHHCKFGIAQAPASILLFGDSHANHFKPFVDVLARAAGRGAVYHVQGACSSVHGVANPEARDPCAARNRDILSMLNGYDYVVLAGAWRTQATAERFARNLNATLDAVVASGATPVVFVDNPSIEEDLSKCVLHQKLGWEDAATCSMSRTAVAAMHEPFDRVIFDAHRSRGDFLLVDAKALMCEAEVCRTQLDGLALYRDGAHLNEPAVRLLAQRYLANEANPISAGT